MKKQLATVSGGYQGDLFGSTGEHVVAHSKQKAPTIEPSETLQLTYNQMRVIAHKHRISKKDVYHIVFEDKRQPLIITCALKFDGNPFWTSLPEGRQQEATDIGHLIESAR